LVKADLCQSLRACHPLEQRAEAGFSGFKPRIPFSRRKTGRRLRRFSSVSLSSRQRQNELMTTDQKKIRAKIHTKLLSKPLAEATANTPARRARRYCLLQKLALVAVGAVTLALYQNFEGGFDIRERAPFRALQVEKPTLAVPESGSDLSSIGQDWLTRQSKLITGGAEERLLADLNREVNYRWGQLLETDSAPARVNEAPATRGPASLPLAPTEPSRLGITSVRILSLNKVQVGLRNKTQVTCAIEGRDLQVHVTKSLGRDLDLDVHHETARAKSVVQLRYSW
jgi:hypothetical protein